MSGAGSIVVQEPNSIRNQGWNAAAGHRLPIFCGREDHEATL
jgi:hypothetical protein